MPSVELLAAGIGAAAGLLSNKEQNEANANLNLQNQRWQEKMAKKNYQRNIELWNMQNAYNTPSEQVKRLRQAGLNPNLLYGNGSAATGNASEISPGDVPGTPSTIPYDYSQASNSIANSLALYQNWQLNNLNMRRIQAEAENTAANTLYIQAMRSGQLTKNKLLGVDFSWANKNYALDYATKTLGMSKTQAEIFLDNARRRQVELGTFQDAAAFETKLELLRANIFQSRASALNAYGSYQEAMARIKSDLYGAQARSFNASASLSEQQYDFQDPFYRNGISPSWSIMNAPAIGAGLGKFVYDKTSSFINRFKRK